MLYIVGAIVAVFLIMLIWEIIKAFWVYILAFIVAAAGLFILVCWLLLRHDKQEKEERERKNQLGISEQKNKEQESLQKFQQELNALPCVAVRTDIESTPPKIKYLSEMPVVNFTTVTTRFNKSNLPTFIVVDTETTGLSPANERIIELSAVRFDNFEPSCCWTTLVNPGKTIPAEATRVNHITDEMVEDAPTLEQISQSFMDFVGSHPIVGYNLNFDLKFLFAGGVNIFAEKRRYYDVYDLSKKAFRGELDRYRLVDVAKHNDIVISDAHRSLSDCYATGLVFEKCIDRIAGEMVVQ